MRTAILILICVLLAGCAPPATIIKESDIKDDPSKALVAAACAVRDGIVIAALLGGSYSATRVIVKGKGEE